MNSRKAFILRTIAPSRELALRVYAWAVDVVEVDSGWIAFADDVEAELWRAQTRPPMQRPQLVRVA